MNLEEEKSILQRWFYLLFYVFTLIRSWHNSSLVVLQGNDGNRLIFSIRICTKHLNPKKGTHMYIDVILLRQRPISDRFACMNVIKKKVSLHFCYLCTFDIFMAKKVFMCSIWIFKAFSCIKYCFIASRIITITIIYVCFVHVTPIQFCFQMNKNTSNIDILIQFRSSYNLKERKSFKKLKNSSFFSSFGRDIDYSAM